MKYVDNDTEYEIWVDFAEMKAKSLGLLKDKEKQVDIDTTKPKSIEKGK